MRFFKVDAGAKTLTALVLAVATASIGCGRAAVLRADALPVRRVVVYRNGVAYFERSGHVEENEVRFKMKKTEVGDFLATLAVMERGGSSVRSAAFPLEVDNENSEARPPKDADAGDPKADPKPKKEPTEDEKKGLETVVLSLDGRAHDLLVGYVAESPVWKPSYRLVVQPNGEADLQAWGIVENLSGEDWKNVRLSLIAGAPLAFEAQLGTPVIPTRPIVSDNGEVIMAVPKAETSLRQEPPGAAPITPPATVASDDGTPDADAPEAQKQRQGPTGGGAAHRSKKDASKATANGAVALEKRMSSTGAPAAAAPPPPPAEPAPAQMAPSAPRNLRSLAAVAVEAGTTRYDLPNPVTIPDKSATMVMLLSRHVPGEALFLFAPDGGVPDSSNHPFRVARFANRTGGVLERGPIAVFEQGSFLGQGLVDPLPDGATATVPFALERSLAVDQERKWDEQGARIAKIENAELTVERDGVTQTKYRLRNGADTPAKILVKHPRQSGTRLFQPPKDTEDNVGAGSALVPAKVAAHATTELVVDERATVRRPTDWFSVIADNAVKAFIADARADRAIQAKLGAAWTVRNDIVQKMEARSKLQQETNNLSQSTDETRRNLRAIEKNKAADALRARLTARLGETSARLDEITKQLVELDSKLAELRIRFKEGIRDINLTVPPPPPNP